MKAFVLVGVLALALVATASASTAAQYRATVNGICRGYTPTIKKIDAQVQKADAAKDFRAWNVAVGKGLALLLTQDRRIEAVPVPAALQTKMKPILARMRRIDGHARTALADAQAGKSQAVFSELLTIGELAGPLTKAMDAAGLRDCGSNQS